MVIDGLRKSSLGLVLILSLLICAFIFVWFGAVVAMYQVDAQTHKITRVALHGFSIDSESNRLFNWHPVLMTLAFGLLVPYGKWVLVVSVLS